MLSQETRCEDGPAAAHGALRTENPAAVQVSPEELARALASLETRRDGQGGKPTIALGEALQQLGIGASPEEVLHEIEALRSGEHAVGRTRIRARLWPGVAVVCLASMAWCGFIFAGIHPAMTPPRVLASTAAAIPTTAASLPPYVRLDAVPDDVPVRCDFATVKDLASDGYDGSKIVDTREGDISTQLWTIYKHRGTVFVRCWASEGAALKAANGHGAVVYASFNADGEMNSRVSLEAPVSRFETAQPFLTSSSGADEAVLAVTLRQAR